MSFQKQTYVSFMNTINNMQSGVVFGNVN